MNEMKVCTKSMQGQKYAIIQICLKLMRNFKTRYIEILLREYNL